MRGRFITLEGGEGAGKSTQQAAVLAWLRARGREAISTREPGGSPMAEAIRALVLRGWDEGVTPAAEVLLMFAARAQHLETTVKPALARGIDVVCDRFVDSSWAYQGAGKGVAAQHLAALEALVLADLRPDLTLILDLPPEQGLERTRSRGEQNRFEDETLAFQQRVRAAFLARAGREPQRCMVIDASRDAGQVQRQIEHALEARLATR